MKLSLNTWQRQMTVVAIGQITGRVSEIRKAMKALDILELSLEEKAQVGFLPTPDGGFIWKDQDHVWELEIKDKEAVTIVKRAVNQFAGWPVAQMRLVDDLFDQLGIPKEEQDVEP